MDDWISVEAPKALERLRPTLRARFGGKERRWAEFEARLGEAFEGIFRGMHRLYGWRYDFAWQLEAALLAAADAAAEREGWLRNRDGVDDGAWLEDPSIVWAMTYVARFTGTFDRLPEAVPHLQSLHVNHLHLMPPYDVPEGPNDGGYAVSSYRRTRPDLGTIDELRDAIKELDRAGIGVVLDFVANHTAHDHPWAEAAKAGDRRHRDFYLMFEDRGEVEAYLPHLREIFPDRGGDAFTWRSDVEGPNGGMWVWTTFYPFQWDLDYRNPDVLVAMARELLYVVNLGPRVVRLDATPFVWKWPGTTCENLAEAHVVIRLFRGLADLVAPGVQFLSEAIVHPDDVVRFVRPDECELGYNPLVMSLCWEAVATRDASLLADALATRSELPEGCRWITYLRSHDDIGWGFADEDARRLGIDPAGHRAFLNAFYAGEFPGSFAAGARFQDNPKTGDARISGTLASLAGLERALEEADPVAVDLAVRRILVLDAVMTMAVGIPLLFLGDEIGRRNDRTYLDDPGRADDNRWMHRPPYDWDGLEAAEEGVGPGAAILGGLRRLLAIRTASPAVAGSLPEVEEAGDRAVLAFRRRGDGEELLVVANLADREATARVGVDPRWEELVSGEPARPGPLALEPYGYRIFRRVVRSPV